MGTISALIQVYDIFVIFSLFGAWFLVLSESLWNQMEICGLKLIANHETRQIIMKKVPLIHDFVLILLWNKSKE